MRASQGRHRAAELPGLEIEQDLTYLLKEQRAVVRFLDQPSVWLVNAGRISLR